jgi:hypothetical protein
MGKTHVGSQVAAHDDVMSGGEGARRPVVPDGQNGRGGLTHRH